MIIDQAEPVALAAVGQLLLPGVTLASFAIHLATISATLYTYSTGIAYPTIDREPPLRCYARPTVAPKAPQVPSLPGPHQTGRLPASRR